MARIHKQAVVVASVIGVAGIAIGGTVAWVAVGIWTVVCCYCAIRIDE